MAESRVGTQGKTQGKTQCRKEGRAQKLMGTYQKDRDQLERDSIGYIKNKFKNQNQ